MAKRPDSDPFSGWAADSVKGSLGSGRGSRESGMRHMGQGSWARRPPPQPGPDVLAVWAGEPATHAELSALRRALRGTLVNQPGPAGTGDDDVERLLLAVEELVSNGLRHGRTPVRVVVTTTSSGWVLDVSDAAPDRPPAPAIGRDAADGGMGLPLVARCARHTAGRCSATASTSGRASTTPQPSRTLSRRPARRAPRFSRCLPSGPRGCPARSATAGRPACARADARW